jgi:hypothetical protein
LKGRRIYMQTAVYRKVAASTWTKELHTSASDTDKSGASMPTSTCATHPVSPELFYPLVTVEEMETWSHWLPTSVCFERTPVLSLSLVLSILTKLNAPPEVLEEFHWTWKLELFEAYEVRTPVRRDARDPLLLGRLGEQWYRIALWGESLLPLEEIKSLVQESLRIRVRAARWRFLLSIGGTLIGLILGWWLGQVSNDANPLSMSLFFGVLGLFFAWFPTFLYTPENQQHDFLDRYRC